MKLLAIVGLNLRRLFRDRTNIFFVIIVPLVMVYVIGLLFGGGQNLRVGVVAGTGPLSEHLVAALDAGDGVRVVRVGSEKELRDGVQRGAYHGGLLVPGDYDAAVTRGDGVRLHLLTRRNDLRGVDVGMWVRSVVPKEGALLRAAQIAAAEGGSFDRELEQARTTSVPGIRVEVTTSGTALFPSGFRQFDVSAPPLLLLFVFFTSLTAAVGMVHTRRIGVGRRMVATPTRLGTVVLGEAAARFAIAVLQALIIILGSAVLFDVRWGDPLAATALVVAFTLVSSGAAVLLGAFARTEGSAGSLAPLIGLGAAGVGGAMVPLETFGPTMRTVAHITPHAWGYDAFVELVRHDRGVVAIAPQIGVLVAFAAVLYALGLWRLRRVLTE